MATQPTTLTKNSYREAIAPYLTSEGFVKNNPGDKGVDGNAWVYTSIHLITLCDLEIISDYDIEGFFINLSRHVCPAGFWRANKIGDRQNHDDIVAILSALKVIQETTTNDHYQSKAQSYIEFIHRIGRENWWFYRYTKPDGIKEFFSDWWWPIFGPVAFFKLLANGQVSCFYYLRFYIGVWSTSRKPLDATSGRQLDWLKCRAARFFPQVSRAVTLLEQEIWKDYEGKMGDVFGIYYRTQWHPFARVYKGKVFLK